jgi:anti-anti-sigma factor
VPDQNELTLDIEVTADIAIVRCRGALTLTSAGRLRHEVKRLLLSTRTVTVDFTDLAMIDSFGLGTMAALYVSARNATWLS